jgi:hypothetical protein
MPDRLFRDELPLAPARAAARPAAPAGPARPVRLDPLGGATPAPEVPQAPPRGPRPALGLESFAAAPQREAAREAERRAETERLVARARSEGHAHGFEEGAAAALARADADLRLTLAALAEALADAEPGAVAARRAVTASALPLFRAVLRAVAPSLAASAAPFEAAARLEDILSRAPGATLEARVSPALRPGLAALLAARGLLAPPEGGRGIGLCDDPALPALGLEIGWAGGIDALDPGRAAAEVVEACEAWFAAMAPAGAPGSGTGRDGMAATDDAAAPAGPDRAVA